MSEGEICKKKEVDFSELLKDFKEGLGDEVGAIGSFNGVVRRNAKKEGEVKRLHLVSSDAAKEELESIASDAEKKIRGISRVSIHHVVDDLEPGDDIVYLFVAGKHRKEVFEALSRVMGRIKSEAQVWKKEITEKDEYWVHEAES